MKVYEICKDCPKRHPKCHGHCPEKAAADEEYQKMKKQMQADSEQNDYSVRTFDRIRKRRHPKK